MLYQEIQDQIRADVIEMTAKIGRHQMAEAYFPNVSDAEFAEILALPMAQFVDRLVAVEEQNYFA